MNDSPSGCPLTTHWVPSGAFEKPIQSSNRIDPISFFHFSFTQVHVQFAGDVST